MSGANGAVLFDLDGTLIKTANDLHACLNQLQAELGRPSLPYEQVRPIVGCGARAILKLAHNEQDPGFEAKLERLLQLYSEHIADHSELYNGLNELLLDLEAAQIPWGIVTNKPLRFTRPLLDKLNLSHRCNALICPEHIDNPKPAPEGILLACQLTNTQPGRSLYFGDHLRDIEAGRNAGCTTIACLYGYIDAQSEPHHWGADYNVATPAELCLWTRQFLKLNTTKEPLHV